MRPNQKAAVKHALTRPRQLPFKTVSTTPQRLYSGLAIFAIGVFFGWLFAGAPDPTTAAHEIIVLFTSH